MPFFFFLQFFEQGIGHRRRRHWGCHRPFGEPPLIVGGPPCANTGKTGKVVRADQLWRRECEAIATPAAITAFSHLEIAAIRTSLAAMALTFGSVPLRLQWMTLRAWLWLRIHEIFR